MCCENSTQILAQKGRTEHSHDLRWGDSWNNTQHPLRTKSYCTYGAPQPPSKEKWDCAPMKETRSSFFQKQTNKACSFLYHQSSEESPQTEDLNYHCKNRYWRFKIVEGCWFWVFAFSPSLIHRILNKLCYQVWHAKQFSAGENDLDFI